jgi:hypothetical protein
MVEEPLPLHGLCRFDAPMPSDRVRTILAVTLLLGVGGGFGCGSSASPQGFNPALSSAASVTWVGIDSRPLAVGTQLTLAFQLPAGKTSDAEALTVSSSDPNIVSLTSVDLAHNRMLVTAVAAGQAAISLQGRDVHSDLPVTTDKPTQIDFLDENYLAAGMWMPLPHNGFGLLAGGQEVIGAVLKDASHQLLNSRGLAMWAKGGGLDVNKEEPEMFVLSWYPSAGTSYGTFCGGLSDPCNESSYPVTLVNAISQIEIKVGTASDNVSVIAVAQALDSNQNWVFGVSDWQFSLNTSDSNFIRLSPAAVQVSKPPVSVTGAVTLTATAVSEGVSATVQLF